MQKVPKRILYIAGCGRSGSTILGFALGSIARTIDLGEVLDFAKFRGRPNGFGPATENYRFWNAVSRDVGAKLGGLNFDSVAHLQRNLDSHRFLLQSLLTGEKAGRDGLNQYRGYLAALYERLLEDERFDVIIDSSKYPSRLRHLLHIFPDDTVCVVHLMRNPIDLADAFRKNEQSRKKSFMGAMMYYWVVNALVARVTRSLGPRRCQRIYFEDFIAQPVEVIESICNAFGLDATQAVDRIRRHQPLPHGFVFNGNRVRVQETVRLKSRSKGKAQRTVVERAIERMFEAWFKSRKFNR